MTFEGSYRGAHHADHMPGHGQEGHEPEAGHDPHGDLPAGAAPAHESPWVMLVPLLVLAAGAVLAGALFAPYFLGAQSEGFWDHAVPLAHGEHHEFPAWVIWAPLTVTVTGFLIAVVFYLWRPGAATAMAKGPVWAFLYNKWYFDEIYDFFLVKGARAVGDLFWKVGDAKLIDGLGPDGAAASSRLFSRLLRRVQTGFVYHYSFLMLIAAVAFGAYAIFTGIGGAP
jgi:NADH-quinone oxidoreductase subunit L